MDDPEAIGAVATHLLAAYRTEPDAPDNPRLAARAAPALRAAAERASAIHAPEQALEYLEGALSITTDSAERAQLWELASASAEAAARLKEAETYARLAIEWHSAQGDRSAVARTTARLGAILAMGYETGEAIAVVRAAVEQLSEDAALRDDPWLAELRAGLARAYLLAGRIEEAAEWADQALKGAERLGLPSVIAGALATKGAALLEAGRTTDGIELLRGSLASAESLGLVVPALRARNSLAVGLLADDPQAALDMAATGLEAARRYGFRDLAVRLASNWTAAALDLGEWDGILELVAELDRSDLPLTDRVDFESSAALVLTWRGDVTAAERFVALDELVAGIEPDLAVATLRARQADAALALGRPDEALGFAETATTLYRGSGLRTAVLWGAVPAARAALWAADDERASRMIEQVEASGFRGRSVSAILTTLRAGLDARRGDIDSAIDRYADASATWQALGARFQLALCDLEAARYLPAASPVSAAAHGDARTILEALGASTLVARLEAGSAVAIVPDRLRRRRVATGR